MTLDVTLDDRNLARLIADFPKEADKIVHSTALVIEAEAKQRAPVDTGNLRASIQTRIEAFLVAVVFVAAEYGYWVEYGTSHASAQPYMTPAVELGRKHLETGINALLARGTA